ncbi:MAG TPA: hypothetical protein PKD64_09970 [Pirellulaceae bacterium]|nr:hypothetical protein [Pirellulaceae bacterium]HMO92507.1 hypothetical protein [Pirellulaceae bacterium]HMP69010.1 hypothetical protein [Pirellulaceae bacterium]
MNHPISANAIEQVPLLDEAWCFGFLTVIEIAGLGYCGGYLILNGFGHPREFHCSLPILATKTQQILYGARLREHVIGEVIAATLLERSRSTPDLILLDTFEAVSIQSALRYPLAIIHVKDPDAVAPSNPSAGSTSPSGAEHNGDLGLPQRGGLTISSHMYLPLHLRDWVNQQITEHIALTHDANTEIRKLQAFSQHYCLKEPFQRIRDALAEAQAAAA